jgi:hypothetical protein
MLEFPPKALVFIGKNWLSVFNGKVLNWGLLILVTPLLNLVTAEEDINHFSKSNCNSKLSKFLIFYLIWLFILRL